MWPHPGARGRGNEGVHEKVREGVVNTCLPQVARRT